MTLKRNYLLQNVIYKLFMTFIFDGEQRGKPIPLVKVDDAGVVGDGVVVVLAGHGYDVVGVVLL